MANKTKVRESYSNDISAIMRMRDSLVVDSRFGPNHPLAVTQCNDLISTMIQIENQRKASHVRTFPIKKTG